jgi:hypothetical protein
MIEDVIGLGDSITNRKNFFVIIKKMIIFMF